MIEATVIADSTSPGEVRITTLSLVFPRFILAELNTHRVFSRNSASSRAIPTDKLIDDIKLNPAMPVAWGENCKGMQAHTQLNESDEARAKLCWLEASHSAVEEARRLLQLQVHKQVVNRVLEPYMHARTVLTGTEWSNFFALRRHPDAQPEIKVLADKIHAAMEASTPKQLGPGEWHTPYSEDESGLRTSLLSSVARCARVSYLTHEGKPSTLDKDETLTKQLFKSGHWSPFEHQATPVVWPSGIDAQIDPQRDNTANFRGWVQLRHSVGFLSKTLCDTMSA